MTIEYEISHETVTVSITGELDLVTAPLLSEYLDRILRGMPRRLVLDLSLTGFIDCGSARLIACAGRSLPAGQRPVIRGAPLCVRKVFQLTGLEAYCELEGV